jgi:hypothetical protein
MKKIHDAKVEKRIWSLRLAYKGVYFKLSLTKTFDPYGTVGVVPNYNDPFYQYPTPTGVPSARKSR